MNRTGRVVLAALAPLFARGPIGSEPAGGPLSPAAIVSDDSAERLYIAGSTGRAVLVYSVPEGAVVKAFPLPQSPHGLAVSHDSREVHVTTGDASGNVLVLRAESGEVLATIPVGHTPMAPVLSPDGKRLYVSNRFTTDVSVVDVVMRREIARIPVIREPVAAAITPDGETLFVANHLPFGPADRGDVAAAVSVIDARTANVADPIRLPSGSTGLRGICVSPDGEHVYVTHILAHYLVPATHVERGWMNTNAMSIIDASGRRLLDTILLDEEDLGAANPWGMQCSPDGRFLCVTHAGSHELSIIDRARLHDRLPADRRRHPGGYGPGGDAAPYTAGATEDLGLLAGIRRRVKLPGNGPRALAVRAGTAYVAEYFTDSLSLVRLNGERKPVAARVRLGPEREVTEIRRGEMLFNDAGLCLEQWQSCASCHPDARSDALNWDLMNDGLANPKQTKSLLLSHRTPPAMVTGVRDRAEAAVRAGIRSIQFTIRPEEDAAAIDSYLRSLTAVASPHLVGGTLSAKAQRGEGVYRASGCTRCHSGESRTDMKKHDLGMGVGLDRRRAFDTPTLVETWRTAPYLHDGRAATLHEMLTKHNQGDRHGKTSGLAEDELDALVEYLLSL